jgi:hypothetical protein
LLTDCIFNDAAFGAMHFCLVACVPINRLSASPACSFPVVNRGNRVECTLSMKHETRNWFGGNRSQPLRHGKDAAGVIPMDCRAKGRPSWAPASGGQKGRTYRRNPGPRACFGRMDSFPSSPAGLTRGSILFARRWIAGSSPATTPNWIDSTETRF